MRIGRAVPTPKIRWVLAIVVVAAIALVVLVTCESVENAPAPPQSTDSAVPAPVVAAVPKPRPRSRAKPPVVPPETTTAPPATEAAEAVPEDDGYPFVDVEVLDADGSPASDAVVYALPAGKKYAGVEPPNLCADAEGFCRLHLLRPGRYDVGAVAARFAALVEDVEVPHEGRVRITLPEPCDVVVNFEQPLVPANPSWGGADIQVQMYGDDVASFPGRDQHLPWIVSGRMDAKSQVWEAAVPAGARCGVRLFDDEGLVASPCVVTAPAEVRVARVERYPVTLMLRFEPADVTFPGGAHVLVRFRVGSDLRPAGDWTLDVAPGQRVADADGARIGLHSSSPTQEGEFRWSGEGVVAGATPFRDLAREGENVVEAVIHLASAPPAPETTVVNCSARIDEAAGTPPDSGQFLLVLATDDGGCSSVTCDFESIPAMVMDDVRWAAAMRGTWTAGPVVVNGGTKSVDVSLTLRPGGYLEVSLARRPPPSLGYVELRRRDGAPFFVLHGDGGILAVGRADVSEHKVLGPFPPGEVVFEAHVSGEPVGEVRATVRAGERTPLVIPSFAPR